MVDDKYLYRIATKEDSQKILGFLLEHFLKDEPLNRASKMPEEVLSKALLSVVDISLDEPFSTIVSCKSTGSIAGVLLISIYKRTDEKHDIGLDSETNPSAGAVGAILNELHNSFFDLVPSHVNTVLHRSVFCYP
ncbi:hypothetical protein OSTOST_10778 [Ostertagia ostertagi]